MADLTEKPNARSSPPVSVEGGRSLRGIVGKVKTDERLDFTVKCIDTDLTSLLDLLTLFIIYTRRDVQASFY
jgi:hypothetical protein